MRIDLPTCGFKSCRYCFDGNCTKKVEYDRCEYREYKNSLQTHGHWLERRAPHAMGGISAKCSACGKNVQYLGNPLNYYPHCCAKMDSVKNKENVRINNV